ncbi:MAG TPA: glycosyltransferase family 39 protein [Chloroflexia bacterium]|nr:glycosyltransferase family 39 protein [Chloroflexia bacterium]
MALIAAQTAPTESSTPAHSARLTRGDLVSMAALLVGFAAVMLLVTPWRDFPINDDWAYAHQVSGLLRGEIERHPWTQAAALTHAAWGALFSLALGEGYGALTVANAAMSLLCLLVFYYLLRSLGVGEGKALFGTAVLGFNPIYVYLAYSFMTDTTFLCMVLLACALFVRYGREGGSGWLWGASAAVAAAFLTRQFGIALVPVALVWLWWSKRWTWGRAAAVTLVPVAALAAYVLWERSQPQPLIDQLQFGFVNALQEDPWQTVRARATDLARALAIIGLCLLPVVRLPRLWWLLLPVGGGLLALVWRSMERYGTLFPFTGNIVTRAGFGICCEPDVPVLPEPVWTALGIAGTLAISMVLVSAGEGLWAWARSGKARRGREFDPAFIVYAALMVPVAAAVVFPIRVFDRYLLPLVAAVIVFELRGASRPGRRDVPAAVRWALLVPVAVFAVLAQHDYMVQRDVRWQAAQDLVVSGVPVERIAGGYEWEGEHLYDAEAERIRRGGDLSNVRFPLPGLVDPEYFIGREPQPGYVEVGEKTYNLWLEGGAERSVRVWKRE